MKVYGKLVFSLKFVIVKHEIDEKYKVFLHSQHMSYIELPKFKSSFTIYITIPHTEPTSGVILDVPWKFVSDSLHIVEHRS